MNQIEMARLASVAHEYRPDWPKQSVLTSLHPLSMRAYTDVAVAMAVCYTDPETNTPKRLLEDGPWWRATRLTEESKPLPPIQDALLIPDADPDDPAAFMQALRERRLVNQASSATSRVGPAMAKQALTQALVRSHHVKETQA